MYTYIDITHFADTVHFLTIGKDTYWRIYPHIFYIVKLYITEQGA